MSRYSIAGVLILFVTGCGAPQQNAAMANGKGESLAIRARSTLLIPSRKSTVRPDRGGAWMRPNVVRQKLMYISDIGTNDVQVYTFPQGVQAGTLTGFNQPQGECLDGAGDVFITNTQASNVIEYTHAGTTPVATLNDAGEYPVACAINPRTGDLAVSNAFDTSFYGGSVSTYKKAAGKPTTYPNPLFWQSFFLSFDDEGNIFVDGLGNGSYFTFELAELHKGSWTYTPVTINTTINWPGGVIWTQANIAVGDQEYAPNEGAVYQIQNSGSGGTVIGTTDLLGACDIAQFFIEKRTTLIGADSCKANAAFYKYPAGGAHTRVVSSGLDQPVGVVVSLVPTPTPSPTPTPTPIPTPTPTPTATPTPARTPSPKT
ncbi:MAG: hypothetical protein ABI431_05565 [Candidatus Tumulicola sp.]